MVKPFYPVVEGVKALRILPFGEGAVVLHFDEGKIVLSLANAPPNTEDKAKAECVGALVGFELNELVNIGKACISISEFATAIQTEDKVSHEDNPQIQA